MNDKLAQVEANSLASWQMMKEQAGMLVKTGFLPTSIKTAEQAMAVMLAGRDYGLSTMQSFRALFVIGGKIGTGADFMLAIAKRDVQGFTFEWGECTPKSATITGNRPGMTKSYASTFTMEDAQRAELLNNPLWKKYPAQMLRARAVSAMLRAVAPDAVYGMYTAEELGATVNEDGEIIDVPAVTMVAEPVQDTSEEDFQNALEDDAEPADLLSEKQGRLIHVLMAKKFPKTEDGKAELLALKFAVLGDEQRSTKTLTKTEASAFIDALNEIEDIEV